MTELNRVHECMGGEWETVCPLCAKVIDQFTAPRTSYEAYCDSCHRWYFLSTAVAYPVGRRIDREELQKQYTEIVNSLPDELSLEEYGPNREQKIEKRFPNPEKEEMAKVLDRIDNGQGIGE